MFAKRDTGFTDNVSTAYDSVLLVPLGTRQVRVNCPIARLDLNVCLLVYGVFL